MRVARCFAKSLTASGGNISAQVSATVIAFTTGISGFFVSTSICSGFRKTMRLTSASRQNCAALDFSAPARAATR